MYTCIHTYKNIIQTYTHSHTPHTHTHGTRARAHTHTHTHTHTHVCDLSEYDPTVQHSSLSLTSGS
jgi:hypothetical protein